MTTLTAEERIAKAIAPVKPEYIKKNVGFRKIEVVTAAGPTTAQDATQGKTKKQQKKVGRLTRFVCMYNQHLRIARLPSEYHHMRFSFGKRDYLCDCVAYLVTALF